MTTDRSADTLAELAAELAALRPLAARDPKHLAARVAELALRLDPAAVTGAKGGAVLALLDELERLIAMIDAEKGSVTVELGAINARRRALEAYRRRGRPQA